MPARLVLAGDGPERGLAEELARQLGVAERVHFLGEQNEVERVLASSDLFLLPSEHESFGLAALEAMSCGVPVLGSASGGLPEVVDDGVTGLLVAVGDVESSIERAVALLRSDEALGAMGCSAREAAVERFGVERVVSRYLEIYESALASPVEQT
jgi:glycosyltransferase involved in cell wall biosynthesis